MRCEKMAGIDLLFFFRVLVFPGFLFVILISLFYDWVCRKVEARMQNRVGPNIAGPAGIFQPLADIIKLLAKERLVPHDVRSIAFALAPILSLSLFTFTTLLIPIDGFSAISSTGFEGDLILVLVIISLANIFLFLAGWASTNAYSKLGASRILMQFIAYDIPLFLVALTPAYLVRSLNISFIAASQPIAFLFLVPWSFILFTVLLQSELEKDPFDIPHAETEIVGGYETEYSGTMLAFLKLARDTQLFLGSAIIVELFLGGPYGPVFFGLDYFWYTIWFILKVLLVVIIGEFIANILARFRIDQVLKTSWKLIMPLSILAVLVTVVVNIWMMPLLGFGG
jgi:NADH-quinone oxidoreductase subunit H